MNHLKTRIAAYLGTLEPQDRYRIRYFNPPIADLSGGEQHYEMLLTKWDGSKWQRVASGSLERVAQELGIT